MVVLIVGIIFAALGGVGLGFWYRELWWVIKGSVPIMFVLFGLAAIAVGISSIKDKAASSKEEKKE
jgi:hypothetical protein